SEIESEDQEQLTNKIERIVADGTDDYEDSNLSEHAIEPKHVTNGNDGLRKNDSGTQLQATVNGEANPEINITKPSANTPPHNVNGSDGLGGNGCGTQLQAATNVNGLENHQAIYNTGNEDNNEQANDNRIGGQQQQNSQESNNGTQYQQDGVNNKPEEIGSPHTTHPEQEIGNPNTSQPKVQPPLITKPPELSQVKRKSCSTQTEDATTQRTRYQKQNRLTKERRKKADVAPVTEDKSAKHSKGNKTSAGSKKQKQGFNSEN
ncbi:MAG: hypothetical protein EZS28_052207, partial [Streblomastix strix]